MPRGDKSSYTDKQKRQAEHIEEGYEKRGVRKKEAEQRAWATVNKERAAARRAAPAEARKSTRAFKERAQEGGGSRKKKTAKKKTAKKSARKKPGRKNPPRRSRGGWRRLSRAASSPGAAWDNRPAERGRGPKPSWRPVGCCRHVAR